MYIENGAVFAWKNEGKAYAAQVVVDFEPLNPRTEDDGLFSIMACFHPHYNLGDEIDQTSPEDFWQHLVAEKLDSEAVVAAAMHDALKGIHVKKEADSDLLDVYETYYIHTALGDSQPSEELVYEGIPANALFDYIRDDLSVSNCARLLEEEIVCLPLWLYDHSGLAISCGDRKGQFADRWDSSQVGWIIAAKNDVLANCVIPNGKDWRDVAEDMLKGEVACYNQYLSDDFSGYVLYSATCDAEKIDAEILNDLEWKEEESCYGFPSNDVEANGMLEAIGRGMETAIEQKTYLIGEETSSIDFSF